MKKLLLTAAAISGLTLLITPAHAEINLEISGYFKGYVAWVDQDEISSTKTNDFDIVRDTEVHFSGETILDNSLTVGAHIETDADGSDDFNIVESYLYLSGDWGRINIGSEDGASYLLQVTAPSADSNYDGIRQYINPFNFYAAGAVLSRDYANDPTGKTDKLTYLSPVFNGFQGGITFSPDTDFADSYGIGLDDVPGEIDQTYEIAARYEGEFNNIGVILGGGYSFGELKTPAFMWNDDRKVWNVGLDIDIGPFGLGTIYTEDNNATQEIETDTIVIGADYTTGPFKIGASYLNSDISTEAELDRYTGGLTYEYGPGMSIRGSINYIHTEEQSPSTVNAEGIALLIGTQVEF
jgi:outer membrane protein OmpU